MIPPGSATLAPLLRDQAPGVEEFRQDVLRGLSEPRPRIPSKYLYDAAGARLFDRICTLDAYYPTRTERRILADHAAEMATLLGPRCQVVEFGSGSGAKTRLLLAAMNEPVAYVPVDISREQIAATSRSLAAEFPNVEVLPLCADYTEPLTLPTPRRRTHRTAVFFPGSTIGNFEPAEAEAFLGRTARMIGPDGAILIGVDRDKDRAVLERAYNDPEGVTAAFNLNLLARIDRELDADFRPDAFAHRAIYDTAAGRIEMHLVSRLAQTVRLPLHDAPAATFDFDAGDVIVTEHSYKYTIEAFTALARRAGLAVARVWSDPEDLFSVYLLRVENLQGSLPGRPRHVPGDDGASAPGFDSTR